MVTHSRLRAIRRRHRSRCDRHDQRTEDLRRAGIKLLTSADFEEVSIASIAKIAKCSVGTFYYRYKDKNTYLRQLVSTTFWRLENGLKDQLPDFGGQISFSDFVSHIVTELGVAENAGIIRVAIKLGATDPEALRPYEDYRESVATTVESIFKDASRKKIQAREIREALQMVFAAINDAALMPKSATMRLGSDEMLQSLCAMAANHIGVRPDFKGKVAKAAGVAVDETARALATHKEEAQKPKSRKRGKATIL